MNLENLQIAVDGIKAMNLKPEQFDMSSWGACAEEDYTKVDVHDCGTIACFGGYFPLVKGLKPKKKHLLDGVQIDIEEYLDDILGFNEFYIDSGHHSWSFLFSEKWCDHDNTLDGAIARAEYLLAGNTVDDGFNYEDFKEGWHLNKSSN